MPRRPTSQLPSARAEAALPVASRTAAPPAPPTLDLRDGEREPLLAQLVRALRKRRGLAFVTFSALLLLAAGAALQRPERFTAAATLLIEPEAPRILEIPQVLSQSPGADAYYETQYEILRSPGLAAHVVREMPPAEEALGSPNTLWTRFSSEVNTWRDHARAWFSPWWPLPPAPTADALFAQRVERYLESLSIEPSRDTRLVRVALKDRDPLRAAALANAHAEAYIEHGLEMQTRASRKAQTYLLEQAETLRGRVAEAQAKLAAYREANGIVSLDGGSDFVGDRLAELNSRVTAAEAERVARRAEWQTLRNRGADALPGVLQSDVITSLKEELARLENEYVALSKRYRPGYPDMAQLAAQRDDARRRLQTEIQNIADGVESAYQSARQKEWALRARLERQKKTARLQEDASVEYRMLETEVSATRSLYEEVQERIKQTDVASGQRDTNVHLLHPATAPVHPDGPGRGMLLGAGLLLALFGAAGTALLADLIDGRVHSASELKRTLGLPHLGAVPRLDLRPSAPAIAPNGERDRSGESRLLARGAPPEVVEAFRRIRTNILLSRPEAPPRTILFTSADAGEGKTTIALHTAQLFAQLGGPVLVIDADLRRPSCHRVFGIENGLGLTELLTGGKLSQQSVQKVDHDLSLLVSGKCPPNATELVGAELMRALLENARQQFDYVLIDGPPVLPVSDSVLMATMVDGVVLVADQPRTQRARIGEAHERLAHARARVLGTVLNRSDFDYDPYHYRYDAEA